MCKKHNDSMADAHTPCPSKKHNDSMADAHAPSPSTQFSQKSSVPKFLYLLSKMLAEPGNSAIIELVKDAGYIQIYDQNRLEREVLSRYFRHSKYSSFHHYITT
jgi:hypothetical protein